MRYSITPLLCATLLAPLSAQTISGICTDGKTGAPIAGAVVWIKDALPITTTDGNGRFSISAGTGIAPTKGVTTAGTIHWSAGQQALSLSLPVTPSKLEVFALNGRQILSVRPTAANATIPVNFGAGIYIVRL